ncbi:unnamed protein product [Schistosoma guineensis]|nr:unnamed protein product [Schistosoma guineensis]
MFCWFGNKFWDAHTFIIQMKNHIDVLVILFSAVGMWLSEFPKCSQSVRVTKDSSSFGALFSSESNVYDLANSSYDIEYAPSTTVSGVLLYANWDADSNSVRSNFEAVQNMIPYNIFAVNCGLSSSLCGQTHRVRHFPLLNVRTSPTTTIQYSGPYTISHLLKLFQFIGFPLKTIRNLDDLHLLILSHKVIALGSFDFQRTQDVSHFDHFYQVSVSTKYKEVPQQMNKNIMFSVTSPHFYHLNFGEIKPHLTLIISCGNTSHVDVQRFGERGLHNLSENLFESRNHSTTTCFNPVDITPLNNRRSNLWNNILRKTPILLLIGPHMSLAEPMDLPLYLLKLLKLSYFPHDECHTFMVNPAFTNFSLNLTMRDSLKIMNRGAIVTARKRCKLAAYCPKWWDFVSFHIGISNESICELRERFSEFIPGDNSSGPISGLLRSHKLNSTASKILALLKNQTVAEGPSRRNIFPWCGQPNEMYSSSSVPNDYHWIDSGVIVEQLNFMCCHWYHVDRLVNMHETFGPECQLDPILADTSYESLKNSVIYNLGCSLNRTLEFHTLDSHLQPTLAWEIGGYSNDSSWLNSNRWGAAIIDMQNENVFRLEEAVNFQSLSQFIAGFHNSTLRPWLRYPKASQHTSVNSSVSSDLLILDVKSSVHLTNLIDQSSGLEKSRKNLILLYYSSTCIYSFGGNSALWQFEATARFFKSNQYLLFARVDVSKLDLPWHLRVENVPCIIFFPTNRSSYSSVFPMEAISSTDLFPQLVSFIYEQINAEQNEHEQLKRFQNSSQFAAAITSQLINNVKNKPLIELMQLLNKTSRTCNLQPLSYSKTLCFSGIRKAIFIIAHDLNKKQLILSKILNNLSGKLNHINSQLTEGFSFLLNLSSLSVQNNLLFKSMHVYSRLWNVISKQNSQTLDKLNIFSNYTHLQL